MLPDYCWGWLSSEFTKELAKKEAFPIELGSALVKQWRTRYVPIRTFSEITADVVIPLNKQVSLYKIYANKAKQLHMLGMSYSAIARSLKIGQETARRACNYEE